MSAAAGASGGHGEVDPHWHGRHDAQGLAGGTAVALDPDDPDVLYVTTTGGMRGLYDRSAQPARLVRLRLTSEGAA
jgi:hypothetical protein